MRYPSRILLWMTGFVLLVVALGLALREPLERIFLANPYFNGAVLAVLAIGVLINFRQVARLSAELRWTEDFRRGDSRELAPPRRGLLTSAAQMLTARREGRLTLSTQAMRAVLDGIRSRLDDSRDLSRYVIGLLIFLGLLGTFWGLLETLTAVGQIIGGLQVQAGDAGALFNELRAGLEEPLKGMGTAFSSSLFGLAGALVLGLFDLQAGHAQNRFYNDLEEWLAGLTQVAGAGLPEDTAVPVYIQALLEKTADSLDKLQRVMTRGEEAQRAAEQRMLTLTTQLAELAEEIRSGQKPLAALARGQQDMPGLVARVGTELVGLQDVSNEVRRHLSNIDVGVTALLGDMTLTRTHLVDELREEIRLLARTLARD